MAHEDRVRRPQLIRRRLQHRHLRLERCLPARQRIGIAQARAIKGQHAVMRGQAVHQAKGEITQIAGRTMDQHQIGPGARNLHMHAQAVHHDELPGRRRVAQRPHLARLCPPQRQRDKAKQQDQKAKAQNLHRTITP